MSYRKSSRPFLICSLMIHLSVLLIMMWFWVEPLQLPPSPPHLSVEITHLARPEVVPRVRIEKPTEPPPPQFAEPVKKRSHPKPNPTTNADWLSIDSFRSDRRAAITAKLNHSAAPQDTGLARQSRVSTSGQNRLKPAGLTTVSLPQVVAEEMSMPPGAALMLEVTGDENELNASSPNVESTRLQYWHRRGAALGSTAMGNTSGGGDLAIAGQPNYLEMMTDLARDVADAATTHEVDLIFILDKTASMEDNFRGIRAYIDIFFDQLSRGEHDTAVGLVTFADANTEKLETRGVTTDHGKFKNWLHKVEFEGGGDLAESGLDALVAALTKIKFRRSAQRFFVLVSDGAFHDADYDGKSEYSVDSVIESLQREGIRVDVIGLDYLPIKQLAWATGGTWRAIPGKSYLEYVPPLTLTAKMLSEFGALSFSGDSLVAELVVYLSRNPRPKRLTVAWKVLNPLGEKCYGPFTERLDILDDDLRVAKFTPAIDTGQFRTMQGTYTVIYRLENDLGHRSILRRSFDWQ